MRREQAHQLTKDCLDELGTDYLVMDDHDVYVTVDEYGHQILLQAFDGPLLAEDATEPAAVVSVTTIVLKDVTPNPGAWRAMALVNGKTPFVKFSANEGGQVIVGVDLFADLLTPRYLGVSMRAVTAAAAGNGDAMQEVFGGERAFWKRGRLK
jgi:hypothetical protein